DDYHSKRLDDVYYPFENNISWLTTRRDEMKQNLAMLQKQHGVGTRISTLIDDSIQTSINARFTSFKDRLQSFTYRLDAELSPSIDIRTRPSIDGDYAARRSKLVTEKSLQDKLNEITFSQDLLKEDLKDISKTTYARLGMQQRNIGNLHDRMHASEIASEVASEVAREKLKNQWTRGDKAIRSFIGNWFQMSQDEVDTCIQTSGHFDRY
ncbi:unnamed protein product, partial [Brassica rapa]